MPPDEFSGLVDHYLSHIDDRPPNQRTAATYDRVFLVGIETSATSFCRRYRPVLRRLHWLARSLKILSRSMPYRISEQVSTVNERHVRCDDPGRHYRHQLST